MGAVNQHGAKLEGLSGKTEHTVTALQQARVRGCAELPNARAHKVLLLWRPQRGDERGLFAQKPIQVPVEGSIRGYVLLAADFSGRITVDKPPPLVFRGPDILRNTGKPARNFAVVQPAPAVDAAPKPCRVKHRLADHLEDLVFEDMGSDPRIGAPLDPRSVVHVLLGLAIAAVNSAMIDGHLARGLYDLVVSPRG
jgi:hypothetical protein